MQYLIDTCVISDGIAPRPERRVLDFVAAIEREDMYLSALAAGEIRRGIERLAHSRRRIQLDQWFNNELIPQFEGRILNVELSDALVWARLTARLERQGRILPAVDSWIAAQALNGGFALVTRNERDFDGTDVQIANPWTL